MQAYVERNNNNTWWRQSTAFYTYTHIMWIKFGEERGEKKKICFPLSVAMGNEFFLSYIFI